MGARARIWSSSLPLRARRSKAAISSGMRRAAEGAIERVTITDGVLRLRSSAEASPSACAARACWTRWPPWRRLGRCARGRIVGRGRHRRHADGVKAITLAEESADDPRRPWLHPGTTCAPCNSPSRPSAPASRLLAAEDGLDETRIDRFVIAGAFGAYRSATALDHRPAARSAARALHQVGNAAGLGVQQMLASRERAAVAPRAASECRYVELTRAAISRKPSSNTSVSTA